MVFVLLGQSQLAFAELKFVTAKLRTMLEQRSFDGRIEAIHKATVSAQTRGRIEDINVDIGDFVVAGILRSRLVELGELVQPGTFLKIVNKAIL